MMTIEVNKEIFKALESSRFKAVNGSNKNLIMLRLEEGFMGEREVLNKFDFNTFVRCLYEGYELEEGPEEKTINKIKENVAKSCNTSAVESQFFRGFNEGIYFVAKTFGIKLYDFK